MTLGREDLLTGKWPRHKNADSTYYAAGYIAPSSDPRILKVVLFIAGSRYKGYIKLDDLYLLVERKTGKAIIHKAWPKQ